MQQIINSIMQFLQQGIAAIFKFLELVWTWSFGQIIAVFQSDWKALPVWKIVILIAICAVIAYVLYKAVTVLWEAAVAVFGAFARCSAPSCRCCPISWRQGSSPSQAVGSSKT